VHVGARSGQASGRREPTAELASKFVRARPIEVWLPPGYDQDPAQRYPVVYLQDGQNLFDATASFGGASWALDQAMERLLAAGEVRPAILVGIWNTSERFAEYMPQKAVSPAQLEQVRDVISRGQHRLKSDAYLKFVVEELKPWIDRTYRTQPERQHTFIMGSSMGGLISAYALVEYPEVFGGAGCVSTHWPAGDGAVIDYLAAHLPPPGRHKFYFDFGTETLDSNYEPYQVRMDAVMRAAGYVPGPDWVTRKFPGARHSERSWSERIHLPLRFLLGPSADINR
jgi:predicted alpha/beta superfamily hydrolase